MDSSQRSEEEGLKDETVPEKKDDSSSKETLERQKRLLSSLKERFNKKINITKNKNPSKRNTEHILERKGAEPQKITSLSDLFKSDQGETIRTVLTVAEEGIDKSFHVQKMIEDWSKNESVFNQAKRAFTSLFWSKGKDEIVLLFPLTSSELSLQKDVSFVELLNHVFEETKQCVMSDYNKLNIVFILDGLDDFKVDFSNTDRVYDVNTPAPVSMLLNSLIRGDLLPSAHLWITSRPAAAAQLPSDLIHRTTQIRDIGTRDELSKQLKDQIKQKVKRESLETELFEINPKAPDKKIHYNDLLNRRDVRTLLTRGVPRIGKTFYTNQFRLDWAEGKCSSDTHLVLSIQLSELKGNMSLEDLLNKFFHCGVSKGRYYNEYKMTIILDGLDKCELPLDFQNNKEVTNIKETAPVDVLLTNLLRGNLLPSARLWILTRTSGENKIQAYIHTVTECRETKKRQQKLASNLKNVLPSVFVFKADLSHPNQKNTEHIRLDGVQENGKKKQITMSDLFKGEETLQIRTVLTIGEAAMGKSYLVCKYVHEWSKSRWLGSLLRTNEESTMLFPFKYSQFDQLAQTELSFVQLLNHVFKETKQCVMSDYNKLNTVFILDGLDDFKVDFSNTGSVSDVNTPAPVSELLSSLIRGDLLPSAHLWITSRPAAAQLPSDLIHRTTQIREKPDVVSQRDLKKALIEQFEFVAEGVDRCTSNSASLKSIYTDLYIIEGESGEVYQQSESRLVQQGKNIEVRKEVPINYQDIFKPSDKLQAKIKTVLTTGVAGIGKTFASMKYMLDWAEGPSTQNINFTFPLPFRELNLRKDTEYSLEELLCQFFPCMKTSEITSYEQYKILIVLDGLDECRLDLNFHQYPILKDIWQKTTVSNLLMNLIVGNLLPEAQVWITSRPAASLCIPNDKVHRVTEVRGFNDEQKEEYFRKRFDTDLAEKILSCLKQSRSIYLMGYIPVFCWITANVFEFFVQNDHQGAPKTLTDLFIHFLLLQCRQANSKYDEASEEGMKIWNERNVKTILGLSKLAFEQLEKGDLLFTEEDLESCGLDVKATVYSGLLTKVKRNESELYPKPLFSFVHLSVQEFLAAFYVSYMFNNKGENVFCSSSNESDSNCSASDFYKSAVDEALKSKNGDWDLFLRFLLGLSLKTNQDLLKDLIKPPENTVQINEETIAYIKTKIDEGSDADMSMNLFHCLNELNDHSLVEEIKKYLLSEKNDYENFSPSKWSALTFVLLTSDEKLDVFDLKKYFKSEKVLLGMMPVVKVATKALLSWCELSELSCTGLSSSVLMSSSSNLTELDLSHNELMDSGVAKLSEGVESVHCKLKILRLAGCRISAGGCSSLTSALRSNRSSHLEELDLSYNHPGPEEQNLKALENDPNAMLKKVCLDHCCEHRLKPGLKKYTADLTFDGRFKHPRIIVEGQKARTWKNVTEQIPEAEGVSVRHVFCEQELSGLCYWELEWDGTVGIGVSYKGAATKSVIGSDDNSWAVFCSNQPHSCLEFDKGAKQASTQKRPHRKICEFPSQKMALYLNWEAGTLSYYSVTGEQLTLITTFEATAFKQPLVPTFWLHSGSVSLVT